MHSDERWIAGAFLVVVALLIAVSVHEYRVSQSCLAAGYPEARIGVTSYCVKRVDQTDVVKEWRSVR